MWIESIRSNVSFKAYVSLLTFFSDPFIEVSGALKSPLFLCFCWLVLLWLLAFVLYIEVGTCIFATVIFLDRSFDHVVFFFVFCNSLYFKVCFVWYDCHYSSFLLISICMEYLFQLPQSVCILSRYEVGLLDNIDESFY